MNRSQLEHIIRACGAIASDKEFIVIGSQSVLGKYPTAPPDLLRSMDADLYPKNKVAESIVIDGAIGEGSMFHQTFGYYAHGVGPETAILPRGWEQRLVLIRNENTQGTTGWCLDPTDLVVSKLVAGRETDQEFVRGMFAHSLVQETEVRQRLALTQVPPEQKDRIKAYLDALAADS